MPTIMTLSLISSHFPAGSFSAALVKALLVNGEAELKGQYVPSEAGPSPNFNSGWGRVDLSKSIILDGGRDDAAGYTDAPPIDDGGPAFTKDIRIIEAGKTLKVSLVWTDPPGRMLDNDLDLIVHIKNNNNNGQNLAPERHGNMGTGTGFDRINNVEQVLWKRIPVGIATLEVRPFRMTTNDQDFALTWTTT
jgi:serine protease AprX